MTRPDISRSVTILAHYNTFPIPKCWSGLLHLITYVKHTSSYSIWFNRLSASVQHVPSLVGFYNSDWAWISTNESEYVALSDACHEVKWLRDIFIDISLFPESAPVLIQVNNKGVISLASIETRSKHVDTCFHFSREVYLFKIIILVYIESKENIADLLTKLVSAPVLKDHPL